MITDLLRLQLELRRLWLDGSDALRTETLHFNEADLVFLALLFDLVDATALVCLDPRLYDRLQAVRGQSNMAGKRGMRLTLDHCPADQASVVLVPIQQIQSQIAVESLSYPDRVVAVYGWEAGWSPALWASTAWPPTLSLRPAANLSPALWRSSIQIAVTDLQANRIETALDQLASILNDRDLDVCMLLERIQTLEETLRGRNKHQVTTLTTRMEDPNERVGMLEREIEELQRTISIMQYGLAFAHSELSKTLED